MWGCGGAWARQPGQRRHITHQVVHRLGSTCPLLIPRWLCLKSREVLPKAVPLCSSRSRKLRCAPTALASCKTSLHTECQAYCRCLRPRHLARGPCVLHSSQRCPTDVWQLRSALLQIAPGGCDPGPTAAWTPSQRPTSARPRSISIQRVDAPARSLSVHMCTNNAITNSCSLQTTARYGPRRFCRPAWLS